MTLQILIYAALYAITVAGALLVLFNRDTVKSAMSLVLVMVSLAAHFLVLGQEFLAATQIIVYAGAIMVLFLFVIMLLNVREREVAPWYMRHARYTGLVVSLVFCVLIGAGILTYAPDLPDSVSPAPAPTVTEIATLLTTKYALPFLLTSVLLLGAVIGSVVMGRAKDPETGEEYIIDDEEPA